MRIIVKTFCFLSAAIILLSSVSLLDAADVDDQRIQAKELKAMVDKGETVLIVDVRSPDEFMKLHITGALSVPLHQVEEKLAGVSPDTKIAFY